MNIGSLIKNLRLQIGKTQFQLAQDSGVSLPTLQNIEAEKGNPGLQLVENILKSLNYAVTFTPLPPDWEELSSLGVPLSGKKNQKPHLHLLMPALTKALLYRKLHAQESSREWEALAAFLLGLKTHFPATYERLKDLKDEAENLIQAQDIARLIKLRRIALAQQALYL